MDSLNSLPIGIEPHPCRYCFSPVMKAASADTEGKMTFHGRAVALVCPGENHWVHTHCLQKHSKTPNTTPADYGENIEGLNRVETMAVLRDNAIANASTRINCLTCNLPVEGFQNLFYADSTGEVRSLTELEELRQQDEKKMHWAINNENMSQQQKNREDQSIIPNNAE